MAQYAILLPGDEDAWVKMTEEERREVYARHEEFSAQLIARGHEITGGAELEHSRKAKVIRRSGEGHVVTEGPYLETVEQLSGFYLVSTDDEDDLIDVCTMMVGLDGGVEIRRMLDAPEA